MSEVLTNRKLRYHDDPHHYSNWCQICGLYYCWHDKAKEFDIRNYYQHDRRTKGHKFEPKETELEYEDYENDYFEEN